METGKERVGGREEGRERIIKDVSGYGKVTFN